MSPDHILSLELILEMRCGAPKHCNLLVCLNENWVKVKTRSYADADGNRTKSNMPPPPPLRLGGHKYWQAKARLQQIRRLSIKTGTSESDKCESGQIDSADHYLLHCERIHFFNTT